MQIASEFVYQGRSARVIFGAGSIRHVEREVLAPGAERVLVLSTRSRRGSAQAVADRLGNRSAGVFARDRAARERAQYGAWLAGMVLGSVGMALHHKLCHALGGSCNLPHAAVHAIVLPHALAYNAPAVPEAMQRIARALGTNEAALGVYRLTQRKGGPSSLRRLGMQADDGKRVARIASANGYWNPRPLSLEALEAILRRV